MKPAPFEYVAPRSTAEALEALARFGEDAKILAGGQSLLPMLNLRLARPAALVDINRVTGLDTIREEHGTLRVGALVRQRALERWAADRVPLLAAALAHVGHAPIRTRGTVAGSVVHADPAAELPALLLCLDGCVVATGGGGERVIAARELFQGPLMTSLRADELVTETRWSLAGGSGWGFHEVARRHGDFALVGVAVVVALGGGRVERARITVFGAGATPVRAARAEAVLVGRAPEAAALAAAAEAAVQAIAPESDVHAPAEYRRRVARTLTARALVDAVARAGGRA